MGGFFLIYLVAVAFSLPIASLLTLGGAALLGWAALPLVVFSATAGAFILFIAASGALQDSMQKRAGPFMERIRDGFNKSPFSGCSPCGWCRPFRSGWSISFRHCLAWAQDRFSSPPLSAYPGERSYIWVGISLQPILAAGRVPNSTDLTRPELLASLAVLAGLAVIPALWRSMKSKGQK